MTTPLEDHAALVAAMRDPAAFPHPVGAVEIVETHISTLLLAGDRAYKLKKPVALGFLDYSTRERRRHACEEELRLGRRTARDLYLAVVPVTGTRDRPHVGGAGPPLEWAVCMRRFAAGELLSERADSGRLDAADVERLAVAIASFHAGAERAPPESSWGTATVVRRWAEANLRTMQEQGMDPVGAARLDDLAAWTSREGARLGPVFDARRAAGFVRECHGDLHLGNVVMQGGAPVPFDPIEFNVELRWIDVMSDVAFAFTDLLDRGLAALAWRFLDVWLRECGDYAGTSVLRYYAVYRALVRAKVGLIREHQPALAPAARFREHVGVEHHLDLAERLTQPAPRLLVAMHGLSGSGKTTVARLLAGRLGGVCVRSDVERKRLFGLAPGATSRSAPGEGIYCAEATRRTHERLHDVASQVVSSDHPVIVDSALLRRAERDALRTLASRLGARFVLVSCEAPFDVLRARVEARAAAGADASEATVAVLQRQRGWVEPVAASEECDTVHVATDAPLDEVVRRCAAVR